MFFLFAASISATNYYCDPINGDIRNSGTSTDSAWRTLEEVFNWNKTFAEGDIIYLMNGVHGNVRVKGVNTGFVTITNYTNHNPKMVSIYFGNSSDVNLIAKNWKLSNVKIGTTYSGDFNTWDLVHTYKNSSYIIIENVVVNTVEEVTSWTTKQDWVDNVSNGVVFKGEHCTIKNSIIKNIKTGIQFEGDYNTAQGNLIANYSGDGMRGLGNFGTFEYNTVQDNYVVDGNHDDGFQSWTTDANGNIGKGILRGVVLNGNIIINYTDASRDFLGPIQGIFGTDGMFEDWLIENNIVIADQWHGISLLGAINCKVINNTVVDVYFGATYPNHPAGVGYEGPLGPSYIRISNNKSEYNSPPNEGNIIRNNITNQIYTSNEGVVSEDHNLVLKGGGTDWGYESDTDYINNFVDYFNFDFHLKSSSLAVDAGTSVDAPLVDADKFERPFGASYDVGAYEYGRDLSLPINTISNISVYPTKVIDGQLTLKVGKHLIGEYIEVKLFTIEGKKIFSKTLKINSVETNIKVDEIYSDNSNFYLLNISSSEISEIFKLLK
jgi:parallel beta-helix repeat protein